MKNHNFTGSFCKLVATVTLMSGALISIPTHAEEKCDSLMRQSGYFMNLYMDTLNNCRNSGYSLGVCYDSTATLRNGAHEASARYYACVAAG
jgi:hypothetical protein